MATLTYSVSKTYRRPIEVVHAHYLDMRHHIAHDVHKTVRYTILDEAGGKQRIRQRLRVMGMPVTDVLLLYALDGTTVVQDFVAGFFKGGRLTVRLARESAEVTRAEFSFDIPMPGLKAVLMPIIRRVVIEETERATEEDRVDLEEHDYQPGGMRAAAAA